MKLPWSRKPFLIDLPVIDVDTSSFYAQELAVCEEEVIVLESALRRIQRLVELVESPKAIRQAERRLVRELSEAYYELVLLEAEMDRA